MERIENIPDYPRYFVTSCGKVWSYKYNKFLKLRKNNSGYYCVDLCNDGAKKTFTVHRLVAAAYLNNPENLPEVDHVDQNRLNNCVNNLRWVSREKNQQNKKNPQREIVCCETGEIFKSQHDAARKMNLNVGNLNKVLKGKYKTTGGFTFKYI